MKKKVLAIVLMFTMIFPMVVYGQGQNEENITSSEYELNDSSQEVAMEYMADDINDRVMEWMEAGIAYEVSPFVEKDGYAYTKVSLPDTNEIFVVGYTKNEKGTYSIIQLMGGETITENQINSYFQ